MARIRYFAAVLFFSLHAPELCAERPSFCNSPKGLPP
jgi:hypothetical protein